MIGPSDVGPMVFLHDFVTVANPQGFIITFQAGDGVEWKSGDSDDA